MGAGQQKSLNGPKAPSALATHASQPLLASCVCLCDIDERLDNLHDEQVKLMGVSLIVLCCTKKLWKL